MTTAKQANLRICASCKYIFRGNRSCPMCGFGSYGARDILGNSCYRFEKTQSLYIDGMLDMYKQKLLVRIKNNT